MRDWPVFLLLWATVSGGGLLLLLLLPGAIVIPWATLLSIAAVLALVATSPLSRLANRNPARSADRPDRLDEDSHAKPGIHHLAYHDTLTDLPNRTLLTDRVEHALARNRRTGQIGALLFLDLDNFKRIHDSLGHSVGDLLLQELANRLRATLREEDTISRLGGDEFVVLLEGLGTGQQVAERQANDITAKLREMFSREYHLDGHTLHVTASIGIVTFPRDGDSMETLLRHADTAMYHAKTAGRDAACIFDQKMDETAVQRLRVENDIRQALKQDQLTIYYQPVMRIRDGRVLGAETLLRWHHPTDGLLLPDAFLPYIEDSPLMLKLDDWILRQACIDLAAITADPHASTPDYVAVNLSRQQFYQPDFVQHVLDIINETGADPAHLQFELTERTLIKDAREAISRMQALKAAGISFSIDDFGTGYSSLSHLKQLPVQAIKVDRGFVANVESSADMAAIVRAIMSLSTHLGLRVVAEGVETKAQLKFLRGIGCKYYQGHLARPPLERHRFRQELIEQKLASV